MLTGWKTKVASIAGILTGVGTILTGAFGSDTLDWGTIKNGWLLLLGGLSVFGLADKLERLLK